MLVNARSAHRWGFKCPCCQTAPGKERVKERRTIKRRDRAAWKNEVRRDR